MWRFESCRLVVFAQRTFAQVITLSMLDCMEKAAGFVQVRAPVCMELCFVAAQSLIKHALQVISIDGGWRHTAAATANKFYAWGWNKWGQLGIGTQGDVCVPTEVEGLQEPISLLACGWRHTLALTAAGEVYSWGRNCNGQLGTGTLENKCAPIITRLTNCESSTAKSSQSCAHVTMPVVVQIGGHEVHVFGHVSLQL